MTQQQPPDSSRKTYDAIADKVGLVPNIRLRDNLIQGFVVVVFTAVGAVVGPFVTIDEWSPGFGFGALAGLIAGGFLSGLVLMVVGLGRKA